MPNFAVRKAKHRMLLCAHTTDFAERGELNEKGLSLYILINKFQSSNQGKKNG